MEYHGRRAAYFISTEMALENMRDDLRVLYDVIRARLASDFEAKEDVA